MIGFGLDPTQLAVLAALQLPPAGDNGWIGFEDGRCGWAHLARNAPGGLLIAMCVGVVDTGTGGTWGEGWVDPDEPTPLPAITADRDDPVYALLWLAAGQMHLAAGRSERVWMLRSGDAVRVGDAVASGVAVPGLTWLPIAASATTTTTTTP